MKLDTLTAPGHRVGQAEAAVLAQAVRTLVRARVAVTGTAGPVMYGLEGIVGGDEARTLAAAMHAAVYGAPIALETLTGELAGQADGAAEGE